MRPTIATKVDRWKSARELCHGARNIMRRDTHRVARREGKELLSEAVWEMLDGDRARREAANRAANLREQIAIANAHLDAANASFRAQDDIARHANEQITVARDGGSQVILDLWLYRAERAERWADSYAEDARYLRTEIEDLEGDLHLTMQEID